MTRDEAVAELVQRIIADVDVFGTDYCIGAKAIKKVLEEFRTNEPIPCRAPTHWKAEEGYPIPTAEEVFA